MALKEKLQADQLEAMKKGDQLRLSVIRMLRSSINYEEIDKQKPLDDAGVHELVAKGIKQRREAIELYKQGKRQDLVDKEEKEAAILQEYLPQQMSRAEVESLARRVVSEVGAKGPADKGKVMGRLMPQTKGKAEGGVVNEVVTKMLEGMGG
ncbi:MAG: GatB/YqeY domain-containing protein [SAR202 cluster bacterium]|nr:GatB/YqeY domain-containing protein [SAR202 cluster bacterium]